MNLARYIANREKTEKGSSQSVMVHIATLAVAISIAVAIISLSVIIGFKEEISSLVSGTIADITIADMRSERQPEHFPITEDEALQSIITSTDNISTIERYALRSGLIRGENGALGIALKGIEKGANLDLFAERLSEGSLPRFEEARHKEILISQIVAEKIGAKCGGRVEIVLLEGDTPRRELFKVCGIYHSALGETGAELALTDIRNVQKINGWSGSQFTGYACRVKDIERLQQSGNILNIRLMHEYEGEGDIAAITSEERHADIFGWLETHDVNAAVILTIMLIVAIFNMVTALLILVMERTRLVGVLKSLGMRNKEIRKIFTIRALRLIVRGIVIGNILSLLLLIAQRHLHLIKLDETGYFLSEMPVSLGVWWILGINTIFATIILLITHLASSIVERIEVAEAIKYE